MTLAFDIERATAREAFRPPAPEPQDRPLGPIALLRTLWRNPLECWARQHFEEPIVSGGLPLGRALLVHEPNAIRRVLLDNSANYAKDRLQRRVLSAGMGEGLLSAEGERWRVQRRIVAPIFARKSIMDFAPAMVGAAEEFLGRLNGVGDGARLDMAVEMRRVTLDVLERTIFWDGFGRDAEEIRQAMAVYFDAIGKIGLLDILGAPGFIPRPSRLRIRATLRFFESAIDAMIAARRRLLVWRAQSAPRDILNLLLNALDADAEAQMTAAEVRSNILTFFAAGHETTANALSWALYLLSQSAEWTERIGTEADRELAGCADCAAERLVETRAVIDEALRLYPPIAAISRVALGPDQLGGARVEPGSLIVISPYVLHRHRRLWDRPDVFDPRRFLGESLRKIGRFAYLPFGAGPRICIGSPFALQEATLILALVVKRFSFELAPGHAVWPLLRVTLRPKGGLPMTIRLRRPEAAPGWAAASRAQSLSRSSGADGGLSGRSLGVA
jgi:cytochrome P450